MALCALLAAALCCALHTQLGASAGDAAEPVAAAEGSIAACASDMDCLLLGTCDGGVCRCRQGFRGPECGQLDLGPAPAHLGYRNATASTWGGLPVRVGGAWHMCVSMLTPATVGLRCKVPR